MEPWDLGQPILPDNPTWLDDFCRGPRGRQGPALVQESESQRRTRLQRSLTDVEPTSNVTQTRRDRMNDGFRRQTDPFPDTSELNLGGRNWNGCL